MKPKSVKRLWLIRRSAPVISENWSLIKHESVVTWIHHLRALFVLFLRIVPLLPWIFNARKQNFILTPKHVTRAYQSACPIKLVNIYVIQLECCGEKTTGRAYFTPYYCLITFEHNKARPSTLILITNY